MFFPEGNVRLFLSVEEMDQYLDYIGGPAGALALTGVAAASAFYLASRPTPQKPLVELHCQSRLLPVSAPGFLCPDHVSGMEPVGREKRGRSKLSLRVVFSV